MTNAKQSSTMPWKLVRVSVKSIRTTSNPSPSCLNTTDNCGQLATPTPAGSSQVQERSDHRTAQKSTAVLPLNLKSRKVRSSLSKGRSLLWHLLTSRLSRTTTSPVRDCARAPPICDIVSSLLQGQARGVRTSSVSGQIKFSLP